MFGARAQALALHKGVGSVHEVRPCVDVLDGARGSPFVKVADSPLLDGDCLIAPPDRPRSAAQNVVLPLCRIVR